MLRELRVSEMRYRAVLEGLDGAVISTVARRYGVSRQTVHAWLRRYRAEGSSGLAEPGLPNSALMRAPSRLANLLKSRSRHATGIVARSLSRLQIVSRRTGKQG